MTLLEVYVRFLFLLILTTGAVSAQSAPCQAFDPFRFHASDRVPPGQFDLAAETRDCMNSLLERRKQATAASKPGSPVSLHRLTHKPAKAARKEAAAANKAARKGNPDEVLRHWRRAAQLDPHWVEARNNHGVQLYVAERYEEAAHEFEQAVALDPMSPEICANTAMALAATDALPAAEYWSRKALRLDPGSAKSQYVTAFVLLRRGKELPRAMRLLAAAAETFPPARPLYEYVNQAAAK